MDPQGKPSQRLAFQDRVSEFWGVIFPRYRTLYADDDIAARLAHVEAERRVLAEVRLARIRRIAEAN